MLEDFTQTSDHRINLIVQNWNKCPKNSRETLLAIEPLWEHSSQDPGFAR